MKAKNDMNEPEIRELFIARQREFAAHNRYSAALDALGINPEFDKIPVVLEFFPDGGCDFVRLLVDGEHVVTMDFPWAEGEPIEVLENIPLKKYLIGKSRNDQNELAIAKAFSLS